MCLARVGPEKCFNASNLLLPRIGGSPFLDKIDASAIDRWTKGGAILSRGYNCLHKEFPPLLLCVHFWRCFGKEKTIRIRRVKYWEIIADNLSKAGWSWGCVSVLNAQRANDLDC